MGRWLPTTSARPAAPPRLSAPPAVVIAVGLAAVAGYAAVLAVAMSWRDYDEWGALVIAPVLFAVTLPVLLKLGRRSGDPWITVLLVGGLALKFAASLVRWYVGMEVYGGSADAVGYIGNGERLAELYRAGQFSVDDLGRDLIGTGFMRGVTGVVFAVTGATEFGGYLIFAWIGYLGMVAFVAAFRTGVPDGDHRRYTALVMLLPSLLYWPSSVGKETWMMLTLGLAALGAARLLQRRSGGLALLGVGLLGASMVRPHMALLVVVAATAAFALRGPPAGRRPLFGPVGKLVGVGVLTLASAVVLAQVEAYFGVDDAELEADFDPGAADEVLDHTEEQTTTGGSSFDAERVRSPADLPEAVVSVLFRPFPWEAHNLQARLAGLEGVALMGIIAVSWRRLAQLPRVLRRSPYVAMAAAYTLMFVVAFSSFGNFGILARQRSQLLPLVVVLLCLPAVAAVRQRLDARNWHPADRPALTASTEE